MSALGQKQTFAMQKAMSASPPKADRCDATRDVCYGPKADIGNVTAVQRAMRPSAAKSLEFQ
jgi:hypothetical protein